MRPQPPEDDCPEDKGDAGDDPEIGGQFVVPLPEPDVVDEALPVAFDNVVDRVELDHVEILGGEDLGGPEDRRHPEEKLDHHADDLPHVAEEDDDRGGDPGETQQEDDGAEKVVEDLEAVEGDRPAVDEKHAENDADEKRVEHQGGEDLDDGEHADAEVDLLEQKGVFHD